MGEVIAILGASGDGKTTLLKSLSGLLPIAKGQVVFQGEKIKDAAEQLIPGHDLIKLVNQDFDLDLFHSVEENIRLKLLAYDEEYRKSKTEDLLSLIGLLELREMRAKELSGGQKQRLAIARALADEPELVLLDEPFNQLDFQMKSKIGEHIRTYLHDNKIAAVLVTHNGMEAMDWADKIVFLQNGEIVREDSPVNFYNSPQNLAEALFFGDINQLEIKGQNIAFRPGHFSITESNDFNFLIKTKFLSKKKLGWFSEFLFEHEGQCFKLFTTEDVSSVSKIFVKPIVFID